MDDATQKLVDEARRIGSQFEGLIGHYAEHRPLIRALADALEAAQRPSVTPEVREEIARTVMGALGCEMQDDTCDCEYPCAHKPYSYCKTHDDLDVVDTGAPCLKALAVADAILTKHSVPSQPVYDEEKIAEVALAEVRRAHPERHDVGVGIVQGSHYRAGFVAGARWLVAALRGGELTREETNE